MTPEQKAKKAERDKQYYEKNKEKIKARSKQWREDNKEQWEATNAVWNANNRDKVHEYGKKSMKVNRETRLTYQRTNYTTQRMLRAARSRSVSQGIPFALTPEDISIPEFCPVLGVRLTINEGVAGHNSPSLDKIIPELGYVPGNVCVISNRANRVKYNATLEELEAVVRYLKEVLASK